MKSKEQRKAEINDLLKDYYNQAPLTTEKLKANKKDQRFDLLALVRNRRKRLKVIKKKKYRREALLRRGFKITKLSSAE